MWKDFGELNRKMIEQEAIGTVKSIDEICIDTSKPLEQRMLMFLKEIENPYYFLCGNTPVRICFLDEGVDLRERLLSYFMELK